MSWPGKNSEHAGIHRRKQVTKVMNELQVVLLPNRRTKVIGVLAAGSLDSR